MGSGAAVFLLVIIVALIIGIAVVKSQKKGNVTISVLCQLWQQTLQQRWKSIPFCREEGRSILFGSEHHKTRCNWVETEPCIWKSTTATTSCWGKHCIWNFHTEILNYRILTTANLSTVVPSSTVLLITCLNTIIYDNIWMRYLIHLTLKVIFGLAWNIRMNDL